MRQLYVLYDRVSGTVEGPVIPHRHDGPATRMFFDVLRSPNSTPASHPEDYELRRVGVQDEDGTVSPCVPETVATGAQWVESQRPEGGLSLAQ